MILLKTIKNFKLLNIKYIELQTSIYKNYQGELFKTEDFFRMKDNKFRKSINVIQYIDYIEKSNLFI